jgi:hypothetical protein
VRVGDGGAHGPSLPRRTDRPVRARTHLAEAFARRTGPAAPVRSPRGLRRRQRGPRRPPPPPGALPAHPTSQRRSPPRRGRGAGAEHTRICEVRQRGGGRRVTKRA